MGEESEHLGLIATAGRAFRSALIIGSVLSIALLVIETTGRAQTAERPMVTVLGAQHPVVAPQPQQPDNGRAFPHPIWVDPPDSRRHDRSDREPTWYPDVPPVCIKVVPPRYTKEAERARIRGVVLVEVVIEADGTVSRGRVLKPLPFGLTQEAIDAVGQWRFRPGLFRGRPVPTYMDLAVRFDWPPKKK